MDEKCTRCGDIIKGNRIKWLELSNTDGNYYGTKLPNGHLSQGCFPFGTECATVELGNTVAKLKGINYNKW